MSMEDIAKKMEKSSDLMRQLDKSIQIKNVWPEAYEGGSQARVGYKTSTIGGYKGQQELITLAWIERTADGERYWLNQNEAKELIKRFPLSKYYEEKV